MHHEIRNFLSVHRLLDGTNHVADDESLLEAGVIDSAAMVDLIAFLEKQYQIQIDEDDMIPENFDSIDAMARYVETKRGAATV